MKWQLIQQRQSHLECPEQGNSQGQAHLPSIWGLCRRL